MVSEEQSKRNANISRELLLKSDYFKDIVSFAEYLRNSPVMNEFLKFRQDLQKSIEPVLSMIQKIQDTARPYLLKAIPTLKYFVIRDSYFYISDDCFLKELEDRYSNTIDKNILLNFIEEFYSRNNYEEMCRLIDELDSFELIEKRIHIIKSVKSVISSGLKDTDIANVVIPVIISQLDGVVKDFYIKLDPEISKKKILKHKNVLRENPLINDISFSNYINILHPIFYLFEFENGIKNETKKNENNHEEYFIEKATEEELENYVLNRNGIMHGEKVDYGKKIELIRVVLFYDTVVKSVTNAINDINKKILENNEEIKIVEGEK
ncbi:MAG TPA: hypothetical protein PKG52_08790 [bacterium]|nr:hypothetical protein [bacterium]HPS29873.1 hypothetical protein [bacterium]